MRNLWYLVAYGELSSLLALLAKNLQLGVAKSFKSKQIIQMLFWRLLKDLKRFVRFLSRSDTPWYYSLNNYFWRNYSNYYNFFPTFLRQKSPNSCVATIGFTAFGEVLWGIFRTFSSAEANRICGLTEPLLWI